MKRTSVQFFGRTKKPAIQLACGTNTRICLGSPDKNQKINLLKGLLRAKNPKSPEVRKTRSTLSDRPGLQQKHLPTSVLHHKPPTPLVLSKVRVSGVPSRKGHKANLLEALENHRKPPRKTFQIFQRWKKTP